MTVRRSEQKQSSAGTPVSVSELNRAEQDKALDGRVFAFEETSPEVAEAYARLGQRPGAVGLDGYGRLVRVPPEGGPPILVERRTKPLGGDLP